MYRVAAEKDILVYEMLYKQINKHNSEFNKN